MQLGHYVTLLTLIAHFVSSNSQIKKGASFESETDTEVIAKLIKHIHDTQPMLSFRELVEQVILQLVNPVYPHNLASFL